MDKSVLVKRALELDREVQRFIRRQTFQAWMQLNLTVPQLKTLFFVYNQGGTNPRKLAAAMRVTPSNVTGIVDRLVDQGLLTREEKPEDRRVQLLRTTQKSEAILSDLREWRRGTLQEILSDMSVEQLGWLVRGLTGMAESVQAREAAEKDENDRSPRPDQEVRALYSSG